jgi:hypothetical protein
MNTLNMKLSIASLLGAFLLLGSTAFAQGTASEKQAKANEKVILKSALPVAVQTAAREHSKGATIRAITKKIEDGKAIYEVEMKVGEKTKDITIADDGALMVVEEQLDLASLPAAVRTTIEKNVGKGKIVLIESYVESGTLVHYEAQMKLGKKRFEIRVSPEGQFISKTKAIEE